MDSPTSTIVISPANSWSSGCSSASTLLEDIHSPTDLGFEINQNQLEDHSFDTGAFYLACVQGGDTLQACLASSDVDLNSPLPGRCGSNVFHEVLRIPADQFQDGKGEVLQLLLRSGADPLAKNDLGDNILHILAGSTEPECHDLLSFLLEEKNDIADVRAACI